MTPQLLSRIFAGITPGLYQKPVLTMPQSKAIAPDWNPTGFMNSPQAVGLGASPLPIPQAALGGGFQGAQINNAAPVVPAAPNDGGMAALLKAFTAPRGRHLGIGGDEMTQANPMGNFGGDPFTNGFFKPQTPAQSMNYLTGTPHPDPMQLAMIQAAQRQRTTTPAIPMPQGDPQARAFWSQMGY